jgi:hypothetical protein
LTSKLIFLGVFSLITIIAGGGTVFLLLQESMENNQVSLDTEFSLKIGQSVNLQEQGIVIEFTDVLDDSRCPSDVECIWEGTVTLALKIYVQGSNLGEYILNSSNLHKASFLGYYVKLKVLNPYPISTETIQMSEYSGTFIVGEYGLIR